VTLSHRGAPGVFSFSEGVGLARCCERVSAWRAWWGLDGGCGASQTPGDRRAREVALFAVHVACTKFSRVVGMAVAVAGTPVL